MLSDKEKSKVVLGHFGPPSLTFPHPIKEYLQTFSQAELHPLRRELAKRLNKMLYIKQLEEMLTLYDCYDYKDETNFMNQKEVPQVKEMAKTATPIFTAIPVFAFILLKRSNPFLFSSYVNNIYGVTYTTLLSLAFLKFTFTREEMLVGLKYFADSSIVMAKSEIHSECIALTNSLMFSQSEMIV